MILNQHSIFNPHQIFPGKLKQNMYSFYILIHFRNGLQNIDHLLSCN